MTECCADRGCALPTADTRGLHPLYKSGAPRRSYLRQRQPSVDPALREYPCFPSQSPSAFFRTHASQRLLRRQDDLSASHCGRQGNDSADLERLDEWMMRIIYGNARLIYGNVFPKSV